MNLPNYFLADLPSGTEMTASVLHEGCQTLKRNRANYLAHRSTRQLIEFLCQLGREWMQPNYPFRKLALEQGPAATGFSPPILSNGLDSFFEELTHDNFRLLLEQEFGHSQRLERMSSNSAEQDSNRSSLATAPEFLVHVTAGNLPNPALQSIVLGVLLRSAQFVKCATGASLLPRLLAHSIYDADPKLGSCLEVAEWRGGSSDLEKTIFAQADCITATGSDDAIASLRHLVPEETRFLSYGSRLSFAFISGKVLTASNAVRLVTGVASDVIAWDQLGCLSPHVVYVETGGMISPEQFAEMLALELERRETTEPRGKLPVEVAAVIASRRSIYELRAAHSTETRIWTSEDSTAWTVVFEVDPRFQTSCLHRFLYVKPVANLIEALQNADAVRARISSVGLAATENQEQQLATELARWGVARICPLGKMQRPPLCWRHDGRPALAELVRWTDWEM